MTNSSRKLVRRAATGAAIAVVVGVALFLTTGSIDTFDTQARGQQQEGAAPDGSIAPLERKSGHSNLSRSTGDTANTDLVTPVGRVTSPFAGLAPFVIEFQEANGQPMMGQPVTVHWRKGFGVFGTDEGVTDENGHFQTTVQASFHIDGIALSVPSPLEGGQPIEVYSGSAGFFPGPGAPRKLVVRAPKFTTIKVSANPPTKDNGGPWDLDIDRADQTSRDPAVHILETPHLDMFNMGADGKAEVVVSQGNYDVDLFNGFAGEVLVRANVPVVEVEFVPGSARRLPSSRTSKSSASRASQIQRGLVRSSTTGELLDGRIVQMRSLHRPKRSNGTRVKNGAFEIRLEDRTKYLGVVVDFYAFGIVGPLDRDEFGSHAGDIEIVLEPFATIAGVVVDGNGIPLPTGEVQLFRSNTQLRPPGLWPTPAPIDVSMDRNVLGPQDNGRFRFRDVTTGPMRLRYNPAEPGVLAADVIVQGGDTNIRIVTGAGLAEEASIYGRVVDSATRRPLPGVIVSRHLRPETVSGVRTDMNGEYLIQGLQPDTFTIHAAMEAEAWQPYVIRSYTGVAVESGKNHLDIELAPATTLHLRVVDEAGAPVRGAEVRIARTDGTRLWLQDSLGHEQRRGTTDASGRVDLMGVPMGPFRVHVWRKSVKDPDAKKPRIDVEVTAGGQAGRLTTLTLSSD